MRKIESTIICDFCNETVRIEKEDECECDWESGLLDEWVHVVRYSNSEPDITILCPKCADKYLNI